MRRLNRGFTLVELLIVVAIIGILAAIAIPNLMIAIQRAKQKRTMTNMRNLATAWEARASDMSKYNAAGIAGVSELITGDDVTTMLQPTYIKACPTLDGWQRELKFYLDSPMDGDPAKKYAIQSAGRDGTFVDDPPLGQLTDFDCDIVYSNGAFLAYPPQ